MLLSKFRFIWQSGFREDFLEINQSETRIAFGGHVCQRIDQNLVGSILGKSFIKIAILFPIR
jgi:hypothetical protein